MPKSETSRNITKIYDSLKHLPTHERYRYFISYSRKDQAQIKSLKEDLESHIPGLTCWYDISGIETGTELVDNIIEAIDHAKFIIAVR